LASGWLDAAMVQVEVGDIVTSSAQSLVNPVHCVGVMGKGLALAFRRRFPDIYENYVVRCRENAVRIGQPSVLHRLEMPWILNFPTNGDWRVQSQITYIVEGLTYLKRHFREWEIASLAMPALGCGEGKLSWSQAGPVLYQELLDLDIPVEPYAPQGTANAALSKRFLTRGCQTKATPN